MGVPSVSWIWSERHGDYFYYVEENGRRTYHWRGIQDQAVAPLPSSSARCVFYLFHWSKEACAYSFSSCPPIVARHPPPTETHECTRSVPPDPDLMMGGSQGRRNAPYIWSGLSTSLSEAFNMLTLQDRPGVHVEQAGNHMSGRFENHALQLAGNNFYVTGNVTISMRTLPLSGPCLI
jgi:hypothetical protein